MRNACISTFDFFDVKLKYGFNFAASQIRIYRTFYVSLSPIFPHLGTWRKRRYTQ